MIEKNKYPGQLVFGLDIGTRSIVGTVGYKLGEQFFVVAQEVEEHKTRAMLDGQIHDIAKVGETIKSVKEQLELTINRPLTEVSIAAAGRVLQTVTTQVDMTFPVEKEIEQEDIFSLESLGVEKAYEEFHATITDDEKFYCVGYSVVKYYLNNYPITNLLDHKGKYISAELIATFLPDDVVDGLYRAVALADLEVANLTLEPIAAIEVAIPEMYRMLNIALVDVGAGTSDICITKDGSIAAYGMIPCAGDSLTEQLARHCLVDFATAERIKRDQGVEGQITYQDIMLLPQTITAKEVEEVLEPSLTLMACQVAEKIKELNAGKAVSAVFVIGGGGKYNGYTEKLAHFLGIAKERVALRGEEVMQKITFLQEDVEKDSLLVTPIGICLNFYANHNNFIFVNFNEDKMKLYDNGKLRIVDVAMQADYPNEKLFPQRGDALNFTVNGKNHIVRGKIGEAAVIERNNEVADLHTMIQANDKIVITPSTKGDKASMSLNQIPEMNEVIQVSVNDKQITLPKFANVNGCLQSGYYDIQNEDVIEMLSFYTVEQIAEFMDIQLTKEYSIVVNHQLASLEAAVYENFSVEWELDENKLSEDESKSDSQEYNQSENDKTEVVKKDAPIIKQTVIVNRKPIYMDGKSSYLFVDIFEYIDFDLTKPKGVGIVTTVNGQQAQYMEPIYNGDMIEVYWKEK